MPIRDRVRRIKRELRANNLNPRLMIGIAAIALAIMCAVGCTLMSAAPDDAEADEQRFSIEAKETTDSPEEDARICVHASGAVMRPGIVYLAPGSRVADAIEAAGGFSEDAARDSMNLARLLEDGEQIHVMTLAEQSSKQAAEYDKTAQGSPSNGPSSTSTTPSKGSSSQSGSGLVNINTATSSELQTLSGIGESKAQKIISYRESNGPFASVDDLTNVSGIGEKTLESIRSSICV